MSLGKRIKAIRKARGWTQEELGQRVGITKAMVSSIELGDRKGTFATIMSIASVLSVSLDVLADDNIDINHVIELSRILEKVKELPPQHTQTVHAVVSALIPEKENAPSLHDNDRKNPV